MAIFLLLFISILSFGYGIEKFDVSLRWEGCSYYSNLNHKTVYLGYLSKTFVNKFQWKINNTEGQLPPHDHIVKDLLSVCFCRKSYPPLFFIIPYSESKGDDIIAVCVIGNEVEEFSSIGVYDDEELYDLLILKHQQLIPRSIMNPLVDSSTLDRICFDLFFKPAKDVMGQKTCLFTAVASSSSVHSLYAGPLMSMPLLSFELEDMLRYCYTTVANTNVNSTKIGDHCFIQHTLNESKLACCCPEKPYSCYPRHQEASLYCFAGNVSNDTTIAILPVEVYMNKYYQPSCTLTITAEYVDDEKNDIHLTLSYGASDVACPKDKDDVIFVASSTSKPYKFCSETDNSKLVLSITRCCNNANLCNHDLVPKELRQSGETKIENIGIPCGSTFRPALIEYLHPLCEHYFDLRNNVQRNLYPGFNAKILDKSRRMLNGTYTYAIANITKEDSIECENQRVFQAINVYIPIIICFDVSLCTEEGIIKSKRNFTCQYHSENQYQNKMDSWFCYVQIKLLKNSLTTYEIVAGHFEIKDPSSCFSGDVLNSTFCCVNVFEKDQMDSECTINNLEIEYKKYLREKTEIGQIIHGPPTQCVNREILDERECPGTDGCFDIRAIETSSTSEVSEPAGCLGFAEEYTMKDLSLASLSLGCRVEKNSNKCSMVYGPDGQQRVVCCCTDVEEDGYCKTESDKLPKQIGKRVSSFKELKP